MDKIIQFIINFRQTNGYKGISYTTYIGILLIYLLYVIVNKLDLINGMAGLIFFLAPLALLLILFNCIIIMFLCIGISQIKSPQGNTNLLHDIGVLICIIGYCYYCLLCLTKLV